MQQCLNQDEQQYCTTTSQANEIVLHLPNTIVILARDRAGLHGQGPLSALIIIGYISIINRNHKMQKYGTQMAQTLFATATSQPGLVASPPPVSGVSQVGGLSSPAVPCAP